MRKLTRGNRNITPLTPKLEVLLTIRQWEVGILAKLASHKALQGETELHIWQGELVFKGAREK